MHLKESDIELFASSKESLNEEEIKMISSHLSQCHYCNDIYNIYKRIADETKSFSENAPDVNDIEIAEKIVNKFGKKFNTRLLNKENTSVQILANKIEVVEKPRYYSFKNIIYLVKYYPLQTSGFVLIAALAIAFIITSINDLAEDNNPVYIDNQNYVLKVLNKDAKVIWEKPSFGIPNYLPERLTNWNYGDKRYINIDDINGDGINEVLISGKGDLKGRYTTDSLYCFNNQGKLLWVASPEKYDNPQAPNWRRTSLKIRDFFTVNYLGKKKLFVVANDASYAGALISELDVNNGNVISTLYHAGWLSVRLNLDLENDGKDEIILGGINTFNKPIILILKSDKLEGVMPDYYSLSNNYKKGTAFKYIQLYCRDLSGYDNKFQSGFDITEIHKYGKNGFMVFTLEYSTSGENDRSGIQYAFDNKCNVLYVSAGSQYSQKYEHLIQKGFVKEVLNEKYYQTLKDSIKYWDGDKFVNHPVENKYYKYNLPLP